MRLNLTRRVLAPLAITAFLSAVATPQEPLTWDSLPDHVDAAADDGFEGVVLVARDDEVVFHRAYGMANRGAGIENRTDTIFAIGSTPIDFTRAAILLLMARGEIHRDDPITRYLDRVPADKRTITLHHLMTGASGLHDFHDRPGDRDPDHAWVDRDEAVRRILEPELLFEPGAGRRHSHSAWGLLAAVVEIASGRSYEEFTRNHLFEPAGMVDTGFFGVEIPADRLAIGYGPRSDGEVNAPPFWGRTSWLVMGSGGMVSTTTDLFRWGRALRRGDVLPEEALSQYWSSSGICRAGNMYGFEIAYTEGADGTQMIVVTNTSRLDRGGAFRPLTESIFTLIDGTAEPATPSVGFPATPQGARVAAFFDAFNSLDIDRYVAFGREHRVPAADQDETDRARAGQRREWLEWGRMDIGAISTRDHRIDVHTRGDDGARRLFGFRFDADPPHLITQLTIDFAPGAPTEATGGLDPDEPWIDLDELLERAREESGMPAIAVAVTKGGEIVASASVGIRRVGEPDRVALDDRFHWGSVGKSVTGTAIGRLIQDGVVAPELTIAEAFPEMEMHEGYRDVTLEQLMGHRGGVPPHTRGASIFSGGEGDALDLRGAFVADLLRDGPSHPVGRMRYSNAGIALAAHMAERRAGATWEALVREHVFDAAGMSTAGHGWPRSIDGDQPNGHAFRDGEFAPSDDASLPFSLALAPAGNVHSSIEDLARYAILHLDGLAGRDGHLDAATVQRIHRPLPGPGEPYAFGWSITTFPGTDLECHWHNGSGGTFFADVKLVPELDLGIAVLMNGYVPRSDLADELGEMLLERYRD